MVGWRRCTLECRDCLSTPGKFEIRGILYWVHGHVALSLDLHVSCKGVEMV